MRVHKLNPDINLVDVQICTRCIYDERVPGISFDTEGVCNYCRQIDQLALQYGTKSVEGVSRLEKIVKDTRHAGRHSKYDCIIGVSGGTDSSYLVHWAVDQGLKPLAVHYDNTWNTAIATQNIYRVLKGCNVDLYTHVVSNKEVDDIFRSFFLAGVPEIEAATDLGFAYTLRLAAAKFGIKTIFEGHSFIEEGVSPLGNNYFDGRYIKSIHNKYGTISISSYPLMTFSRFMKSVIIDRPQFIRPLWYLDYSKEKAKILLKDLYGWQDYGGHHLENRLTAFYHSIYLPQKFSGDFRNNTLSANVRNGTMTREEAWKTYNTDPPMEAGLLEYVIKRLNISNSEYDAVMKQPPRNWTQYPTYKRRFERLRYLFLFLAKSNLVPMSFYLKYCVPKKTK